MTRPMKKAHKLTTVSESTPIRCIWYINVLRSGRLVKPRRITKREKALNSPNEEKNLFMPPASYTMRLVF